MICKLYSPTVGIWGKVGAASLLALACAWCAQTIFPTINPTKPCPVVVAGEVQLGGTLLIAGGGNLSPLAKEQFMRLAGGPSARLVMIPGHYVDPEEAASYYDRWRELHPASLTVLNASSACQANDPEFTAALDQATGVWLGGGQQEWLTSCYRGTLVETKIRQLLLRNGIVGGTSAGAAVMSDIMITGGRKTPTIDQGFGLLPGVVVDQHFIKRNRFARLRSVIENNSNLIGLGIDEDAALFVSLADRRVQVVGDSYIVLCWMNRFGTQPRVEVDFYNPGEGFQLRSPQQASLMLASAE